MQKTFLLGLGAPKCGTTWQYDYIARFATADMGFRKEYFIWNAVTLPAFSYFRVPEDLPLANPTDLVRREMQRDPEAYFSYFTNLLARPSVSITGDLTASYAGLAPDTLIQIRKGFEERGVRCKVIFMMRDPVERCQSMVRMYKQKTFPKGYIGLDLEQNEESLLLQYYNTPHCHSLTSYENTLANIHAAGFATEDTFIGFYETFFSERELYRFTQFLNLPLHLEQRDRKSNATRRLSSISYETRARIASRYADTYRACQERFPNVTEIWPGYALLNSVNYI